VRRELELDPLGEAPGDSNGFLLEAALDGSISLRIAQNALYDHNVWTCGNAAKVSFPRQHVLLEARGAARLRSSVFGCIPPALGRARRLEVSNESNTELAPTLWRIVEDR
jgi:hypothetical protein